MDDSTVKLVPYDYDVADEVFNRLFISAGTKEQTEDGLCEIPAASYQLVVSALEYIRWETGGEWHDTINRAISIAEDLRDWQKMREWKREREQKGAQN